jgi:very-short-patch-repair endonuclease
VERAREFRRAMTAEESILWEALRQGRLGGVRFRRQQVIDGFIADFYCHQAGLVIEVDGGQHREQAGYDAERDRILALHGLRVLRVSNDEVRARLPSVLRRIAAAVET